MACCTNVPSGVTVTFNPGTVVITGYTIPVASSTIARDVTATVVPPECAEDIDLVIASSLRATITNRVDNTTTGVITFKVKGTSATPSTGSDTVMQARCGVGGELLASVPVTVMIPKKIGTPHPTANQNVSGMNQVADATTSPAYFGPLAPDEVALWTNFIVVLNIHVFNQFNGPLDGIYAGVAVDEFEGATWKPINQQMVVAGTYADPVGAGWDKGGAGPHIVKRNSQEAQNWPTDPPAPCFNFNVTQNVGVRIGGHILNPGVVGRQVRLTTAPCNLKITWP